MKEILHQSLIEIFAVGGSLQKVYYDFLLFDDIATFGISYIMDVFNLTKYKSKFPGIVEVYF